MNENGYAMKKGVHLDGHTETIVCPLFNNNNNHSNTNNKNYNDSVLMRVEKTKSSGFSMALPSLSEKPKTVKTYFVVSIEPELPNQVLASGVKCFKNSLFVNTTV